ncbi:MAG: chemotaxis protein CheW [Planctomycetia bacterium]|nr:chemotaxis protein CheW [Planctomycetia bacterium]
MTALMQAPTANRVAATAGEQEFITFYLGDLLLGIDIHQVQEINRNVDMTPVPHAPQAVRGVINLRGEVVLVVDLREVLGLPKSALTRSNRNVIVKNGGEQIGLLVDRVADVVRANTDDLDPMPENLRGIDQRFFKAVYKLELGLLVILDVNVTLASICNES